MAARRMAGGSFGPLCGRNPEGPGRPPCRDARRSASRRWAQGQRRRHDDHGRTRGTRDPPGVGRSRSRGGSWTCACGGSSQHARGRCAGGRGRRGRAGDARRRALLHAAAHSSHAAILAYRLALCLRQTECATMLVWMLGGVGSGHRNRRGSSEGGGSQITRGVSPRSPS